MEAVTGSEYPSWDLMNSRSPSDKIQGTGRYPDGGRPGDSSSVGEGKQGGRPLKSYISHPGLWSLSQVWRETMNSLKPQEVT